MWQPVEFGARVEISAHTFAKVRGTYWLTGACPTRSHTEISFSPASTTLSCFLPASIRTPSKAPPPALYDMRSESQGGF